MGWAFLINSSCWAIVFIFSCNAQLDESIGENNEITIKESVLLEGENKCTVTVIQYGETYDLDFTVNYISLKLSGLVFW